MNCQNCKKFHSKIVILLSIQNLSDMFKERKEFLTSKQHKINYCNVNCNRLIEIV